jgi:thiamine-phosphate pyrophosphorylase
LLLYYITDRNQFSGLEAERRSRLLDRIAQAAAAGIDFIQLREKDLSAHALARLASDALGHIRLHGDKTKLLINSRLDVALAVGADGVHLAANDPPASEARAIVALAAPAGNIATDGFLVGVSCHSLPELRLAEAAGADFIVLAPIFEKAQTNQAGMGVDILRQANSLPSNSGGNRAAVPAHCVLALGGVTLANAAACVAAGAAGIAGIRLFQQGDVEQTVRRLRAL